MSKDRIQILLRKIGALLEDDQLSKLEKDLAKKYILEIYEQIDHWNTDERHNVSPQTPKTSDQELKPEDFKVDPIIVPPVVQDAPIITAPISKTVIEERMDIELSGQIIDRSLEQETLADCETSEISGVAEKSDTLISSEFRREVQEVVTREDVIPEKYISLFQRDTQKELSEKLGLSPISDLRRALGINDKLLVVNELFGGKSEAYQETVDILNSKYSFSEAKSYLTRYVIDKFKWLDEEKIDPARDFIKLVERRFLDS